MWHKANRKELNLHFKESFHSQKKQSALLLISIFGCGIACPIFYLQIDNIGGPQTFTITNQQAQSFDLVVYFPDFSEINSTICQIFQEVNATITIGMSENQFNVSNPDSITAANAVSLLNAYGVRVEMWPLFDNALDGEYPNFNNVNDWSRLYNAFENWTLRNNLNITYLLWDIESVGYTPNQTEFQSWPMPFQYFGKLATYSEYEKNTNIQWEAAIQTIETIGNQSRADNHIMRATTAGFIWDLFAGDDHLQRDFNLPAWDASPAFEYVSMMAYRGCEGGGTPGGSSSVYETVRASSQLRKVRSRSI